MKIYLDFDRTIFDNDLFLEDLYHLQEEYYLPNDLYTKCYKKIKDKGFNPYHIFQMMEKEIKIDQEFYQKVEELMKNTSKYIYQDVLPFLEKVKKRGYKLILFTKGEEHFQLKKIENAHLLDSFDAILNTLKLKGELDLDYEESIFIDDNPNDLLSILKRNPKRLIRVKRENTKYYNQEMKEEIETVSSFEEIKL